MLPSLVSIGMEYLSRLMNRLKCDPNLTFTPKCERLSYSYDVSDDLLMFAREDSTSTIMLVC